MDLGGPTKDGFSTSVFLAIYSQRLKKTMIKNPKINYKFMVENLNSNL